MRMGSRPSQFRAALRTWSKMRMRTGVASAISMTVPISATLGSEVFQGDAHALLMTVYKDLKQPIGLRMEAALPYEKPRLASIENKVVDEFESMSIAPGPPSRYRRFRVRAARLVACR